MIALRLPLVLASVALLPPAGCLGAADSSCEHATDAISVVAVAVDDGEDLRAEIDFDASDRSSFPHPLVLCDDDVLRIGGKTPRRTDRIDRVVYSVNLPASDAPREVEVVLQRKAKDDAEFTITLPPAFDVIAPEIDEMVSRGADYLLEWAPPQPDARIRIALSEEIGFGLCLQTATVEHDYKSVEGVDVDDTGSWTVPANIVASADGGDCEAEYAFKRLGPAPYPDAFLAGGFVEGRTERTVAFRSVP